MDQQMFLQIYDTFADKIYAFIYYKTLHKETAEDLTSTTFLKAYERISTYDEKKGNTSQWIYSIARNTVIDHFRAKKSITHLDDIWDAASDDNIEKDIDEKLTFSHIKTHLSLLTPTEREVLILKYWQGYEYSEIAEIVEKTPENCRMIVSRGIKKLQSLLLLVFFSLIYFL